MTPITRFAWLSIAAALTTIALKMGAYYLTGSVGLLSDALESLVNLVAAIMVLFMLNLAAKPADEEYHFGYDKAEYFSSGVEGALIIIASLAIGIAAVKRLLHPQPLQALEMGLSISIVASVINYVVARILRTAGKERNSITLQADAQHLMTDVWTSAGVVVGVGLARVTGWQQLDPIIALLVAANIVRAGGHLVKGSVLGLMDTALPAQELALINEVLDRYRKNEGIEFHALRARGAASQRFVSVHVLVPGDWSVQRGHDLLERFESDLRSRFDRLNVFTHLEPIEDPVSWEDVELDRPRPE